MKAVWNNHAVAESDATIVVEGNHYFPPESVTREYLAKNGATYACPWKGLCDYYDVAVEGKTAKGAAWMYPNPKPEAERIRGYFAFWEGVRVVP